jgi:hypothetical protein
LIDESLNVVVHNYLEYRIAELKFYRGYCCLKSEREKNFLDAIEKYIKLAEFFGAQLPVYENFDFLADDSNIKYKKCDGKIAVISAYFCNTIGEAYSQIVMVKEHIQATEETINEYGQKALFYCFYATKWDDIETYYRNYGCAIERHYEVSDKTFNKLKEIYTTALLSKPKLNCFHVLLSLYDKYFNQHLGIKSVKPDKEREFRLNDEFYQNAWYVLEENKKNLLLNVLDDLKKKSSVAATMYPDKSLGYTYSCIYNRDMCIINKVDIQKSNVYYLEGLKYLEVLEVVAPSAALTKILRRDFNNLAQFFNA